MRLAINGFGRIGRLVLRAALERNENITFVAINDLADAKTNAHLLQYDSTHGRLPFAVRHRDNNIEVEGQTIQCLTERNPADLPWKELNVDLVLECTGLFTARDRAAAHLEDRDGGGGGAKKVLISGPSADADKTIVFGVNDSEITPDHRVISNASCTTNCLAPTAKVLHELCGISHAHMTTVHSYTSDQSLLDTAHSDLRRARAAANAMIPTSTGAAKAIALVMPELEGKIAGTAIRVPTPNVSLVDLVAVVARAVSIDEVNQAFVQASQGALKNILAVSDQPLTSIDFNHSSASSTIDLAQTNVVEGTMVRVMAWYDNEWGFANRMLDVSKKFAAQ